MSIQPLDHYQVDSHRCSDCHTPDATRSTSTSPAKLLHSLLQLSLILAKHVLYIRRVSYVFISDDIDVAARREEMQVSPIKRRGRQQQLIDTPYRQSAWYFELQICLHFVSTCRPTLRHGGDVLYRELQK